MSADSETVKMYLKTRKAINDANPPTPAPGEKRLREIAAKIGSALLENPKMHHSDEWHKTVVAVLRAELRGLLEAAEALLTTMETCHICSGHDPALDGNPTCPHDGAVMMPSIKLDSGQVIEYQCRSCGATTQPTAPSQPK